jgi:hypothetical protein
MSTEPLPPDVLAIMRAARVDLADLARGIRAADDAARLCILVAPSDHLLDAAGVVLAPGLTSHALLVAPIAPVRAFAALRAPAALGFFDAPLAPGAVRFVVLRAAGLYVGELAAERVAPAGGSHAAH